MQEKRLGRCQPKQTGVAQEAAFCATQQAHTDTKANVTVFSVKQILKLRAKNN